MRITFLCKRRYTGKDVIADRFGRLYEIPRQLAELGHTVRGYCLDYHARSDGAWAHEVSSGSLKWKSRSLGRLCLPAIISYPYYLEKQLRDFAPDVLIGASDIPHAMLTAVLSHRLRIPCAIDLYDNFESFWQAHIPGFVAMLKQAVRKANLVTVVSEPLKEMVDHKYARRGPTLVMANAIDKSVFRPFTKREARIRLGLPQNATLVGTAGSLYKSKGLEPLYRAWPQILSQRPDSHLVLAGPLEKNLPPPQGERVRYLGQLSQMQVADMLNALDVGVVTLLDSPFGRYCFPQKAYEMLACDLPIVAANVGAMSILLKDFPHLLYAPNDANALAHSVVHQIDAREKPNLPIPDWKELVTSIEPALLRLASAPNKSNKVYSHLQ